MTSENVRKTDIDRIAKLIHIPDLNKFRIGDRVICSAPEGSGLIKGTVVGIEIRRTGMYGRGMEPSLTIMHDGGEIVEDGFKPSECSVIGQEKPDESAGTLKAEGAKSRSGTIWNDATEQAAQVAERFRYIGYDGIEMIPQARDDIAAAIRRGLKIARV